MGRERRDETGNVGDEGNDSFSARQENLAKIASSDLAGSFEDILRSKGDHLQRGGYLVPYHHISSHGRPSSLIPLASHTGPHYANMLLNGCRRSCPII